MRKLLYLFGFLAIVSFDLSAHNSEEGVVIAGVRWATRNVDAPGTFAQNPEDTGQFYQWGRQQGWAATGVVANWDSSISPDSRWLSANDPCPTGWRMPTADELRSLRDAGSERKTLNGVAGRLFGNAPYQIFLPATGWRLDHNGALVNVGSNGYYWSNAQSGSGFARYLGFLRNSVSLSATNRAYGFSVRCVSD